MRNSILLIFLFFGGLSLADTHSRSFEGLQKASAVKVDTIVENTTTLRDTHWRLIELNGKFVPYMVAGKEMYMFLRGDENKAYGSGGCNSFSANYTLKGNDQLSFRQIASTRKYCDGLEYENNFFKALSSSDHFYLNADTLILWKGNLVKVARFVAVK